MPNKPINIKLDLVLRPVSINDAYYRAGQLKAGARKYRHELLNQLLKYKSEIQAFRAKALELINNNNHSLKLEIVHMVPNDTFYTVKGQMSMRAGDTDNYTKLLQDFLLNPRYCEESESYNKDSFELQNGTKPFNIGIDDRFVQTIVASKVPCNSDRWQVQITCSVLPIVQVA